MICTLNISCTPIWPCKKCTTLISEKMCNQLSSTWLSCIKNDLLSEKCGVMLILDGGYYLVRSPPDLFDLPSSRSKHQLAQTDQTALQNISDILNQIIFKFHVNVTTVKIKRNVNLLNRTKRKENIHYGHCIGKLFPRFPINMKINCSCSDWTRHVKIMFIHIPIKARAPDTCVNNVCKYTN